MQELINYYINAGILEWFAVITSLAYVILAAYQHRMCWPAALLSTMAYSIVFYEYYLWSDSALQLYYLVMAVYGWYCWRSKPIFEQSHEQALENVNSLVISAWSKYTHIKAIIILTAISILLGYIMKLYTPTDFPYLDAATTVFAVFTTYLVTQKVLENWLYWIVINSVSIYLYVEKALIPTAFLFIFFVVISIFGYFKWLALYKKQSLA